VILLKLQNRNYIDDIKEVLLTESTAIEEYVDKLDEEFNRIVEELLACKGKVIFTGMGKSGLIAKKIAATFASLGTPSIFMHPAEGLHGDLGVVTNTDIVVAISNSGETEEVLNIIPTLKEIKPILISMVSDRNSTLARRSDYVIPLGKIKEACPLGLAPTTSTTLQLAIGDALAIALLNAKDFKSENFALFHPGGSLGKKLLLKVSDVLNRAGNKNPVIQESSTVKDALFTMTDYQMGATSIVNNEGEMIGILTDGDIRRTLTTNDSILNNSVIEIATVNPTWINEDEKALKAMQVMKERNINVLPVIRNNKPVGMIHIQDLTKEGINV
jgi:arabinose-5-phosphate isomerase